MGVYHIAVLECDTPVDTVVTSRGTYGDIFEELLTKGLEGGGPATGDIQLRVSKWDVVGSSSFPDIREVDAILLSGSKHTAFEDDAWIVRLVDRVKDILTTHQKPLVGICFGHQIIGRAMGAAVGVSHGGWEVSVNTIDLNSHGRQLLGTSSLSLHQMHKDAVLEVPKGLVNLGSSPSCPIQGLYKKGSILSFQAHPEFDEFTMSQIIQTRHVQNVFDDAMFNDGMAKVGKPHGGALVASAIWQFLLDG
ncbi:hypothetical protein V502_02579 [Pseudogymnoascus sp. VKM F-4520 (FW-2644)]|nr:hypothetical protein V502_02579 [Pseudogymnoascus sp. VKM F-4520 (FW-2644)]